MADSTAGGRQIDGFHGISIEYMRSKKFLQGDGGYAAIVWMPQEIKQRLREFIPEKGYDTIATEEDAETIDALHEFLVSHDHPVVHRWNSAGEGGDAMSSAIPVITAGEIPINAGGVRIILKNARIYAEKVIIQPVKPKKPGRGDDRE
jgi:acetyl-CoA decarbonylase/synthase complex subunit beta